MFKDFALAFWKTARDDIGRAEDAMRDKAYSYVVFHSQHSLEWFKGKWSASRYPFIKGGKVVTPSEDFTEIEASLALSRARFVFSEITSLLKKEYMLDIKD